MKKPQVEDALVRDTRALGPKVRLIDTRETVPEEYRNRVVTESEAHRVRLDSGLDLIVVSKESDPPVVKLMDHGRYKFEQSKRQREQNRKQREHQRDVKEVQFRPAIEQHDYETKLNQIKRFIDKGHNVRIVVKMNRQTRLALPRGMSLAAAACQDDFILKRVIEDLGELVQETTVSAQDRIAQAELRKPAE